MDDHMKDLNKFRSEAMKEVDRVQQQIHELRAMFEKGIARIAKALKLKLEEESAESAESAESSRKKR